MDWASDPRNRRRFYRLQYPLTRRPRIEINDGVCEVVEVSERGLRLHATNWHYPEGTSLTARIHFSDGTVCVVQDVEVIRIDGSCVVLIFSDGISMQRMATEQRKIIRASLLEGRLDDLEALRVR